VNGHTALHGIHVLKIALLGRKWQDILKEINLKLWNKFPSDGRSNVCVSVLLEGWLPWCCIVSICGGRYRCADTSPTSLVVHLWIYTAHCSVPVTALDTKELDSSHIHFVTIGLRKARYVIFLS
jgi:hypothetical protein